MRACDPQWARRAAVLWPPARCRRRSGSPSDLATATHVGGAGEPRADQQQGAWLRYRLAAGVRWFRRSTRSTATWRRLGLLVWWFTQEAPAVLRAAGEAEAQCQDQKMQSHGWDSRSHSGRVVEMSNGRAARPGHVMTDARSTEERSTIRSHRNIHGTRPVSFRDSSEGARGMHGPCRREEWGSVQRLRWFSRGSDRGEGSGDVQAPITPVSPAPGSRFVDEVAVSGRHRVGPTT
jgi:hypothetical protein